MYQNTLDPGRNHANVIVFMQNAGKYYPDNAPCTRIPENESECMVMQYIVLLWLGNP
jgi:hypothetical protein